MSYTPFVKHYWQKVNPEPVQITASTLSVLLDAGLSNGRVEADAIWLEREACSDSPYEPQAGDYDPDPCYANPSMAVQNGAHWIVEHQQADGSWLHQHSGAPGKDGPPCEGQCPNDGSSGGHTSASTAYGILGLIGAGYSPLAETNITGNRSVEPSTG